MSSFNYDDEIQKMQTRIFELEKHKKDKEEYDKKHSLDHNFKVINDVLTKKKTMINTGIYSKSAPLARYYDQELVTRLDAIYNILQILNNRLDKLEESS
jgi:hypothetical protein